MLTSLLHLKGYSSLTWGPWSLRKLVSQLGYQVVCSTSLMASLIRSIGGLLKYFYQDLWLVDLNAQVIWLFCCTKLIIVAWGGLTVSGDSRKLWGIPGSDRSCPSYVTPTTGPVPQCLNCGTSTLGTLMTSAAADVINHRSIQTVTILLG